MLFFSLILVVMDIFPIRSFQGWEAASVLVKCIIGGFVCTFSAAILLPYTAASSVYIFLVTVFVITLLVKYVLSVPFNK